MRGQRGVGVGVGGVGGSGIGNGGNYGGDGNPQHVYPAAPPPPPPPPPQHLQMQQQEQYHPQQQTMSDHHHNQWSWDKDGPKVHSPMSPHMFNEAPPPQHIQMQQQEQHHPQQQTMSDHHHNQWRWDKDGPQVHSPMSPHMFNEGQGSEASRSYYQGQRPELRMAVEKQCGYGAHSQPRGDENMRFEENPPPRTFEGVEQKFLDDIMKLSNQQNNAEDAEYTRHWERINAIYAKYQERRVALRARHASRIFDFLRRESHSRQQKYQQVAVDHYYPSSSSSSSILGPSDPQEYNAVSGATPREPARPYNRYNSRKHEPEPRIQYPVGRA